MEASPHVCASSPAMSGSRAARLWRSLRHGVVPAAALCTLALPVLAGCGAASSSNSSTTLTFGAPVSLTGSLSHEGQDTLNGYNLWASQVNAHGGIKVGSKSYQVKVVSFDDGSSTTKSAQLTQQLITSNKVNFLLGPYGTPATLQDESIAEQYKMPMVEGNGAAKAIFAKGNKYIFGVLSPTAEYAQTMLKAALALPNPPKTVAIIYASDAFSKEVADAANSYASSHGMTVTKYQEYPQNATDLTSVLTAVKTSNNGGVPDMLLGSGHENEAIVTMQEAKQLGVNINLYAFTVGPALPDFITTLKGDANDVIGSSQWTPQEKYNGVDVFGTPANFTTIYKQTYHQDPSYQAAESAACGLAFQFAIQKAGSIDSSKVRDALAGLDVQTFYGEIRFDSTGINTYKPMATIQIQNATVVTIYPQNVANASFVYPTPAFGSR